VGRERKLMNAQKLKLVDRDARFDEKATNAGIS
jgi:hypothetical protein